MKKEKTNVKRLKKLKKNIKGITLIALVVTIIVLLILAGVAINLTIGQNGIFQKAEDSMQVTKKANDKEKLSMAILAAQIGENGYKEIEKNNLEESVKKEFDDRNVVLLDSNNGSFLAVIDDKLYKIENNNVNEVKADLYINNESDLINFRNEVNNGDSFEGKYIVLTSDIISTSEEWIPIGEYKNDSTIPEDPDNKYFSGIFNGMGHSISNVKIDSTEKVKGLFGLNMGGTITNLSMLDCNIKGGIATGGIAGYNYNGGKIINCKVSGNIEEIGARMAGGIAGNNIKNSIIENCMNMASVSGPTLIGGITGLQQDNSYINSSYNIGNIIGNDTSGGIVGMSQGSTTLVKNCYNRANVKSTKTSGTINLGGIAGRCDGGIIKNTYSIGNVEYSFNDSVGIIAGSNLSNGNIYNSCYWNTQDELNGVGRTFEATSTTTLLDNKEFNNISSIINEEKMFKEDENNINDGYPILIWQ